MDLLVAKNGPHGYQRIGPAEDTAFAHDLICLVSMGSAMNDNMAKDSLLAGWRRLFSGDGSPLTEDPSDPDSPGYRSWSMVCQLKASAIKFMRYHQYRITGQPLPEGLGLNEKELELWSRWRHLTEDGNKNPTPARAFPKPAPKREVVEEGDDT